MTELAILQSHINGTFLIASLAAKISNFGLVMSMHVRIASCKILVVRDLVWYLWFGWLSSLSCKM
jgi:hypothetical protein